ncbi:Transcriptional regulator, AbiEi antitoxin, Type IV TA system [Klenkia marina]|uniref:Transcriptional regulator, AbiEi antitoxin, Type IV TA system n=1 Tax=Klenkia marina TaxID=1960309 RepID=A0A1G4Y6B0_9ACTN|nr:DUF559 domain-containing protein [Klenkia marina]SCX49014.1 Transcriptional regulator, AbiEi antitoxin, Type IV TA system [Klenkia marina]
MHALSSLLPHGAARRDEVTLAASSSSVTRWLADGDLVLPHPGVLALPGRIREWDVRARAATLWAHGPLSHQSALVHLGLLPRDTGPIHVTVPADRWPRGSDDVLAHRTTLPMAVLHHRGPAAGQGRSPSVSARLAGSPAADREPPTSGRPEALPVLGLARSLVDAWAWASCTRLNPRAAIDMTTVRHALIGAVRDGQVEVAAVRAESAVQRTHAGRRTLEQLLGLIEAGCQSELEVFGLLHVLRIPDLPRCVHQHEVALPGVRARLDAAWPHLRVAVELDGHRFHSSRADRERDMRRDTALAAAGWVVLRFSHARLTTDPEGCRREIELVLRRRAHELAA